VSELARPRTTAFSEVSPQFVAAAFSSAECANGIRHARILLMHGRAGGWVAQRTSSDSKNVALDFLPARFRGFPCAMPGCVAAGGTRAPNTEREPSGRGRAARRMVGRGGGALTKVVSEWNSKGVGGLTEREYGGSRRVVSRHKHTRAA
jgi:hypothetical protein